MPPNILASLLGGVDPHEMLETLARFMKETIDELKYFHKKLDNIERLLKEKEHV